MAGPPTSEPLGLRLTRTAKAVSRAFDEALAEAGGSLPTWLVLVSIKSGRHEMQREIADAVGIEGATLTHHLNRMEAAGLVVRSRNATNRRVQSVALTPAGDALFFRLLRIVQAFDGRLRAGLSPEDVALLEQLLQRLEANSSPEGKEHHHD